MGSGASNQIIRFWRVCLALRNIHELHVSSQVLIHTRLTFRNRMHLTGSVSYSLQLGISYFSSMSLFTACSGLYSLPRLNQELILFLRNSLDDRRIQFPHAEFERVPLSMLFVYSLALPLTVITVITIFVSGKSKDKWHQLHVTILGLSISLLFTSFFTDLVKVRGTMICRVSRH